VSHLCRSCGEEIIAGQPAFHKGGVPVAHRQCDGAAEEAETATTAEGGDRERRLREIAEIRESMERRRSERAAEAQHAAACQGMPQDDETALDSPSIAPPPEANPGRPEATSGHHEATAGRQSRDAGEMGRRGGLRSGEVRRAKMTAPEHGTIARYRRGCRCESCRSANATDQREYQRRRRESRQPVVGNGCAIAEEGTAATTVMAAEVIATPRFESREGSTTIAGRLPDISGHIR
jgi:hypothetical protein